MIPIFFWLFLALQNFQHKPCEDLDIRFFILDPQIPESYCWLILLPLHLFLTTGYEFETSKRNLVRMPPLPNNLHRCFEAKKKTQHFVFHEGKVIECMHLQ